MDGFYVGMTRQPAIDASLANRLLKTLRQDSRDEKCFPEQLTARIRNNPIDRQERANSQNRISDARRNANPDVPESLGPAR
jgi:hypothetical protein